MNVKQMKWILKKALMLIEKYEEREFSDKDWEEMFADINEIYNMSKKHGYCKKILVEMVECFDRRERGEVYCEEKKKHV